MRRAINIVENRQAGQTSGIGGYRKGHHANTHGSAWLLMALVVGAGAWFSTELVVTYGGHHIYLSDWIKTINMGICGVHGVLLVWLATTAKFHGGPFSGPLLAFGAMAAAVQFAVPFWEGQRPWAHEQTVVSIQRHLTFAPSVLRDIAGAGLGLALIKRGNPLMWLVVPAFLMSAGGAALIWADTPYAIIARIHGAGFEPIWVGAGLVGMVGLGLGLSRAK